MKKIYEKPSFEVISLRSEDIATGEVSAARLKVETNYQTSFSTINYY